MCFIDTIIRNFKLLNFSEERIYLISKYSYPDKDCEFNWSKNIQINYFLNNQSASQL